MKHSICWFGQLNARNHSTICPLNWTHMRHSSHAIDEWFFCWKIACIIPTDCEISLNQSTSTLTSREWRRKKNRLGEYRNTSLVLLPRIKSYDRSVICVQRPGCKPNCYAIVFHKFNLLLMAIGNWFIYFFVCVHISSACVSSITPNITNQWKKSWCRKILLNKHEWNWIWLSRRGFCHHLGWRIVSPLTCVCVFWALCGARPDAIQITLNLSAAGTDKQWNTCASAMSSQQWSEKSVYPRIVTANLADVMIVEIVHIFFCIYFDSINRKRKLSAVFLRLFFRRSVLHWVPCDLCNLTEKKKKQQTEILWFQERLIIISWLRRFWSSRNVSKYVYHNIGILKNQRNRGDS